MSNTPTPIQTTTLSEELLALPIGENPTDAAVILSNELVGLLSSQLYRTPAKAIEELVVNSFDADAKTCRLAIPSPADAAADDRSFCAIWDDGVGMDTKGLIALWEIGSSPKKRGNRETKLKRKQIGRFGIGKLATHAIANRVTYISKTSSGIVGVTVDYTQFADSTAQPKMAPVPLRIIEISNWNDFSSKVRFITVAEKLGLAKKDLAKDSWTLVLLEKLKDKVQEITQNRLRWILSTAMPLASDFTLFLNQEEIRSSKESINAPVQFEVTDFPDSRIADLNKASDANWKREGALLINDSFPTGVSFQVRVFEKSLGGKSDDMIRSHGFFLRVRGRLINEDNSLFGLAPLSHTTFQRFRADVFADDLDSLLLSSREEIEQSAPKKQIEQLLGSIFNEARIRYENWEQDKGKGELTKQEGQRAFVQPRLVEEPLADVLLASRNKLKGSEPNNAWFYVAAASVTDIEKAAESLYTRPREQFRYKYENIGSSSRIVSFSVNDRTFTLNLDHDLVAAHWADASARRLLEDVVTADMLLEVYLRDEGMSPEIVGEILERRDQLLRGLARESTYSFLSIAKSLRDASANQYDLEIAVVRAARALGFVAMHVAGSGEPDGLARLSEYPGGEQRITLEAKSSKEVPSLSAIDFAGLAEHVKNTSCHGCLLVAPSYPNKNANDAAAANRADMLHISCWTIEHLAAVLEKAEARHLTAQMILGVVKTAFAPLKVVDAVEKLLQDPEWAKQELLQAVLEALRKLDKQYPDRHRTVDMVAGKVEVSWQIKHEDILESVRQLAAASKGGMRLTERDVIILATSIDEIENRAAGLLGSAGAPRGKTRFREQ